MNLTAAVTITVYFTGLVNFSGNTADKREVVVPLASTPKVRAVVVSATETQTAELEAHVAEIVLNKVSDDDCDILGGTQTDAGCTLSNVTGTRIGLPAGKPADLDVRAHGIPKLQTLCSAVSGIKTQYLDNRNMYAVRLTISDGTLAACANGAAWSSRLVLADTNGKLDVETAAGKKTVTLATPATIAIANQPVSRPAASGREHFWWHYEIAEGADQCLGEPVTSPPLSGCLAPARHGHGHGHGRAETGDFASGLGCSNSQYP